jgi:outer membrane protein assembly factor BamA
MFTPFINSLLICVVCVISFKTNVISQSYSNVEIFGLENVKINEKTVAQITNNTLIQKAQVLKNDLVQQGYLACGIDSVFKKDSLHHKAKIYFYLGEKYEWVQLHFTEVNKQLIQQSGYSEKDYTNKPINPTKLAKLIENILLYYENNGYPFVQVSLNEIVISNNKISASLNIVKGPLFQIKSIQIKGDEEVDKKIVHTLINIKEGDLFNQELIYNISSRIKETPFLEEIRSAEYEFTEEHCNVYLYIKNKNANSFNAIIGILPSDNGKINITGDARIKLLSTLHKGELLDINWRKLLPLTQNLNLHVNYPFLFNTNFGIDSKFDLYKKDTSYIDLNIGLGVIYQLSTSSQLTAYFNNRRSDLISTIPYQFLTQLPNFADVTITSYGILYKTSTLNYKFNPTKGLDFELNASAGAKKIRKNSGLNEIVYQGINLSSSNYRAEINAQYYIPIKRRSALKTALNSGFIINESIFENELFRLGGNRTIRGFDEESIFASTYGIFTLEYRYLLEENSALFAFAEGAKMEKNTRNSYSNFDLYSFGAGINFQTKPGIFSVSYALGAVIGNPLLIRSAKIHFGFINYF